jgi:two-component system, NtrC family, sensor histidine kinase KinB
MKIRHLQTRFILAGGLLVLTTVLSGIWSALTFAHLSKAAGKALQTSRDVTDLTAILSNALEREDDAILLVLNGDRAKGQQELRDERQRFDDAYKKLLETLTQPNEKRALLALGRDADRYRAAGDGVLKAAGQPDWAATYLQRVNPALRQAVADCAAIRELNFRSMRTAATLARDEAWGATIMVTFISAIALIISSLIAVLLARSVLIPIQELSTSVEAIRTGDFDRRVQTITDDELGRLGAGFNRMAESLAEFRRSNLSEVLRANETLEATIAALPDAVIVIDPEARIVTLNRLARALMRATGADNANRLEDLPLPASDIGAIRMALRGERRSEIRSDFNRALTVSLDGRQSKFILTAVPIPEFWPKKFGAAAILSDVTDFARLDELRMELVAVASHELKTPLTTLRMNLMLLGERAGNLSARQHEILSTALLGCQELAATIDELLDLTRIEAGQLRLSRDVIDLYGVIDRSVASLRQRFEDASITVKVASAHRPARVVGDPARLGMVFTNLLGNALKYTPPGGNVSIGIGAERNSSNGGRDELHIAVSDTGAGIPAEFRERVFEKFFRVEQQNGRLETGTWGAGIGLYLCRQIIEAHGGTISCSMGDGGHGTKIEMILPTAELPT